MCGVKSRRRQAQASKSSLLVESHRMRSLPSAVSRDLVVYQGSSLDLVPRVFFLGGEWEGLFIEPPSLPSTHRIPDSQKESSFPAQAVLYAQLRHSELLPPVLGREPPRHLSC